MQCYVWFRPFNMNYDQIKWGGATLFAPPPKKKLTPSSNQSHHSAPRQSSYSFPRSTCISPLTVVSCIPRLLIPPLPRIVLYTVPREPVNLQVHTRPPLPGMPNSPTSGEDVAAVETLRQPEDAAVQEEEAVSPVLPTTPAPSPAPEDEPGLSAPMAAEPDNAGGADVATATTAAAATEGLATEAADTQSAIDADAAAAAVPPADSEAEPSPAPPQADEGPAIEAADVFEEATDAASVDTTTQAAEMSVEASTIEERLQFTREVRIVTVETTVATTQVEAAPAAAPAVTLKGLLRAACERSAPSLFENFTPADQMKRLARIGVATPSALISAIADGTLNESLKCKGPYWYTASQIHAIIGAAYPTTDLRRPLLWFGWDRRAVFARDSLQGILAKLRAMGVTTPGELATALAGENPPLDDGKPMFRKIVAQALLAFLRQPGGVAPTLSAESAATQWAADPSEDGDGNDDVPAVAVPPIEEADEESAGTTAAAAAAAAAGATEECDGATAGDAAETADEFAATAATTLVTSPEEARLLEGDADAADSGSRADDGRTFVVGGYVRRPPLLCPPTELVLREPHAGRFAASPQRVRGPDETPRAPLTAFAHFRSLEFAPADDNLFAPPVGPSHGAGGASSPPPASRPARKRRTVQKPATATDLKAFAKSTMKQPALQVRNPMEVPPASSYDKTELPPVVPSLDQSAPLNPSAWAQYKSIDGQLGRSGGGGGGDAPSPAKPSPVPEMRCVSPQRSPPLRPAEVAYGAAGSPPDVSWAGTVESARRLCEINTAIAAEVEALRDVRSHSEFTEQSHGMAVRAHELAMQQHRARSGASAALKSMSPARTSQPYADVAVAAASPMGERRPPSPLAPAHLERIFDRLETQLQAVEKQLDVEELTASTNDLQRQFTAAAASQAVAPRPPAGKTPDTFVI